LTRLFFSVSFFLLWFVVLVLLFPSYTCHSLPLGKTRFLISIHVFTIVIVFSQLLINTMPLVCLSTSFRSGGLLLLCAGWDARCPAVDKGSCAFPVGRDDGVLVLLAVGILPPVIESETGSTPLSSLPSSPCPQGPPRRGGWTLLVSEGWP
jgi:hypothetical protein